MNTERIEVKKYIDDVKAAIDRMKKAVSQKEEDIEHARLTTEGNEVACHQLELGKVEGMAALQQSKVERQRATYMEEVDGGRKLLPQVLLIIVECMWQILAKEARLEQERARETTEA